MAESNAILLLAQKVMRHMEHMAARHQVGGIFLAGEPGVGKTAFVKSMGPLLGMKVIIIEVPHITEEHLINIPFIVFDPRTNSVKQGMSQETPDYKLVLAQSNLYTQMVSVQPISDHDYLEEMKIASKSIQKLFKALGGNEYTIPEEIKKVRHLYKTILFLDEFYRETTVRIRNIMRGILNGNIGLHKIPSSVYIMYASNMNDTGLQQEIHSNEQFKAIEKHAPSTQDWFDYIVDVYEHDTHVRLNPVILDKFKAILKDEDLTHTDVEQDVRTSPRRWEQLLLYISTSLPVSDHMEARSLLTNVKNNFINYQTEKHGDLAKKVTDAVAELIKETSRIDITAEEILEPHEWRSGLSHAIEQQKRGGERRQYIPLVSGPPGIGKEQPLYSKIKIPSGWTTMGEISVGDIITAPDGTDTCVTGVYPQGKKDIYRVTFADGRVTDCGLKHLWKVQKDREDLWQIVDTEEIIRLLNTKTRWVYVPLVKNITEDIPLPLNPYLLGCLLGDGSISQQSIRFSTSDIEIINSLTERLDPNYKFVHYSNYDYSISQIVESKIKNIKGEYENAYRIALDSMKLMGSNSYTKFIPTEYKQASVKQKEELLAGLVDTDGYINKQGAISITTSSPLLANDIVDIVRSIGGIAKITSKIPVYTYEGEKKNGKRSYNVSIRYPYPKNLSKLTRKLKRIPDDYQYAENLRLRVVSIDLIGQDEAQCIMVDHPDHLYITDDYIVTHNTSEAASVAREHKLRLIEIDVSEIYADDAIGMPLPGERDEETITVKFSLPKLYHQIMNIIKEKDAAYIQSLKDKYGDDAQKYIKEYEHQRWKYLIFFDEINRVDPKTFNSLRKVILEKSFGPAGGKSGEELKLPKEAIVVAAMNPKGAGTEELTHHFRDVVDIVPAKASWAKTKKWLMDKKFEGVPPETKDVAMNIIEQFINKFKSKDEKYNRDEAPFHLEIGIGELYIAAREYADMFATLIREVGYAIKHAFDDPKADEVKVRKIVDRAAGEALEDTLNFICYKHGVVDKTEFMHTLKEWVTKLPYEVYGGLLTKKATNIQTLSRVLSKYLEGTDIVSMPEDIHIINANNNLNNAQFIEEIKDAVLSKIVDTKTVNYFLLEKTHPGIMLTKEGIVRDPSKQVSLLDNFFLANLYALHLHNYSNDRIGVIGKSFTRVMSDLVKSLRQNGKIDDDTFHQLLFVGNALRAKIFKEINQL